MRRPDHARRPRHFAARGRSLRCPARDPRACGEVKCQRSGAVMAALCRTRAVAAERHLLRLFLSARPCRGAGTESGSGSESPESAEPRTRPGGFASALERHSELQRKAGLGRTEVSRGSYAGDVVGGDGSRDGARRGGAAGDRAQVVEPGGRAEPGVGSGAGARSASCSAAGNGACGSCSCFSSIGF